LCNGYPGQLQLLEIDESKVNSLQTPLFTCKETFDIVPYSRVSVAENNQHLFVPSVSLQAASDNVFLRNGSKYFQTQFLATVDVQRFAGDEGDLTGRGSDLVCSLKIWMFDSLRRKYRLLSQANKVTQEVLLIILPLTSYPLYLSLFPIDIDTYHRYKFCIISRTG